MVANDWTQRIEMNWFTAKLFGKKKSRDQDLAEKLYEVLVLGGGPSSSADSHIDSSALEIPLGKLESFSQKRLISLEALLFVAAHVETAERSQKLQAIFGDRILHPFAIEMGDLIGQKWRERGIEIQDDEVSERCFDEVEELIERPSIWSRVWLREFYADPEQSDQYCTKWADQWIKEFKTMKMMVADHA
jgi:hypothetical protein